MKNFPTPKAIRPGAAKAKPFTVLIVANPALEDEWNSANFIADPITLNQPAFEACAAYVEKALFGALTNQAELLLGDPDVAPHVRVLSLFKSGLTPMEQFSFVAHDDSSVNILVPRRDAIQSFLQSEDLAADIVFAISGSTSHERASSFFTSDDDAQAGVPFLLDGIELFHRFWCSTPGTVALHASADSLTALHEFQHAISSYSNGKIVDQYIDLSVAQHVASAPEVNVKLMPPVPPVPPVFGHYTSNPTASLPAGVLASDLTRHPLRYPPDWESFHCERHDPQNPAIMDNYSQAPGGAVRCQNDKATRQFIMDRVRAKLSR